MGDRDRETDRQSFESRKRRERKREREKERDKVKLLSTRGLLEDEKDFVITSQLKKNSIK